jgi:hypothetical protein
MIALVAALLLQAEPAADVACIELASFEVRNSEIQQSLVAEGSMLNRTPWDLGAVSVDVVIVGDNKFPLKTMPRQVVGALKARKGVAILIKDAMIAQQATRFTTRVILRYTVEGQERTQTYENLVMRAGRMYVDPEPGPKLGVMGLRTIAGSYKSVNKQQVYSGDSLFLRMRVDGFDDKATPAGQVEVTFTTDGKKQSPLKRSIESSHLKVDAGKLPANDVDPKVIAYDGAAKELLIGLRRVEDEGKLGKISIDVRYTTRGQTWTWTGLDAPFLEALRPPDKK